MVLLSATMPAEVLEVTKKFMRDPVRILVKKEELTLEGIKQFYINVEREVCVCGFVKVKWKPSLQKHPTGTAGARPRWLSSCGHVSTGTPGKQNKGTGLKTRQWGTSFLMSSVFCLKALCHRTLWFRIFKRLAVSLSNMVCFSVSRSGSWTPCVICTRR